MARPSKRTPQNAEIILNRLKAGGTRKAAYMAAGIGHETFAEWLKADAGFLEKVEAAEQESILFLALQVSKAASPRDVVRTTTTTHKDGSTTTVVEEYREQGDWRAAAWRLERMDPENFAKKVDLKKDGDSIKGYGTGVDFGEI